MRTIAVVLAGASLAAQTPTFRAGTTLIELRLVVLDSDGRPVTDLAKEELVLTEGGRSRDVAFLRFDGDAPALANAPAPPVPPGFVTNRFPETNVTAIVLDLLNVNLKDVHEKHNQGTVRETILQYLDTLPQNTHVGLFRFAEDQPMATLQTFTDDVERVRSQVKTFKLATRLELETASGRPGRTGTAVERGAMAEAEARALASINSQLRDGRVAKTLANLEALGRHMAGIPGGKNLVWISDGVPIRDPDTRDVHERAIRQTAQRLANQGITLYPVVAAGLAPVRRDDGAELGTFGVFASVTGGQVVKDANDLTLGVTLAANDLRGTYTVGFYAADELDDEWRPLEVEIKRRGVTARHRQGYLAVRRSPPENWPRESWNDVAYQPLDSTAIRLNARSDIADHEVRVSIEVVAADLYFHERDGQMMADLEIGLVEKNAKGPTNVRAQPMEISLTQGARPALIPLKTTWPLNASTVGLRVIVRDRLTGRYGSLEMPADR